MFSHILWILGTEKMLATPLTSLIPKLIPTNGTVIWETDLILRDYSNIMGATAVGGYYLLCGLQGNTKTWETVRLLEGMRASSFSLFLFSSSSSSLLSQPKYNSTGSSKWGYTAMPAFSSPPPWETREAGFPLCHFSFENSLHCPKSPERRALGVPCHGGPGGHSKPNESWRSGREAPDSSKGNLVFWRGRKWTAGKQSAKMSSETLWCSLGIAF